MLSSWRTSKVTVLSSIFNCKLQAFCFYSTKFFSFIIFQIFQQLGFEKKRIRLQWLITLVLLSYKNSFSTERIHRKDSCFVWDNLVQRLWLFFVPVFYESLIILSSFWRRNWAMSRNRKMTRRAVLFERIYGDCSIPKVLKFFLHKVSHFSCHWFNRRRR